MKLREAHVLRYFTYVTVLLFEEHETSETYISVSRFRYDSNLNSK